MPINRNTYHVGHVRNARADSAGAYGERERALMDPAAFEDAAAEIVSWPGYAPTPVRPLPGLARSLGLRDLRYKDEGGRFGLGSFKALGGAYAVRRFLGRRIEEVTGTYPGAGDMLSKRHADVTENITVCSATDGNHGRSVAWGAQMFGCQCIIYIPKHASQGREEAIAAYGARVVRHNGNYDETVRHCAREAEANGWTVISDTSYDGYTDIPRDVMSGYTVIARELLEQLAGEEQPTHVFLQGGVGGFAAGVAAPLWCAYGADRPRFVFVNPETAAPMFESMKANDRTAVGGDLDTVMACLSCGEVSIVAWELLRKVISDVITIPDECATDTMRLLAEGVDGDAPVVAGESGCAGLAGLIAATGDPEIRAGLGLSEASRVLVIGTEGATDPVLYAQIVGRAPSAVAEGVAA